jgi:hypothetical protein
MDLLSPIVSSQKMNYSIIQLPSLYKKLKKRPFEVLKIIVQEFFKVEFLLKVKFARFAR